ncbi:unnamed protein product, partial [Didymodactylos carnosus]
LRIENYILAGIYGEVKETTTDTKRQGLGGTTARPAVKADFHAGEFLCCMGR